MYIIVKKIFSGKRALVIGGTGGIGKAVALDLGARGAEVIIHGGNSPERLQGAIKAIQDCGGKAGGFLLPVKNPGDAEKIYNMSARPDILICAWGPFRRGSLESMDAEFWQSMANFNLVFPGILVSLALPVMIKQKWGRILFFGGTNTDTIRGYTTSAAYSAAKTALGVIAKSAARTAPGMDITCNVICPGLTDTEYLDDEKLRYNHEKSPGGALLIPADISGVCMEILANPAINGAVIPVDRGLYI